MPGVKKNFLFQLAASATQVIIPLFLFPYVSRTLGPSALGTVSQVEASSQFFIAAGSLGLPLLVIREIARKRYSPKQMGFLASTYFSFHALTGLVASLLFLLIALASPSLAGEPILILLALINVVASSFVTEWFLQGMEQFRYLAFRSLFFKAGSALAIFIFVKKGDDFEVYYGILVLGALLSILSDFIFLSKAKIPISFSFKGKQLFKSLFWFMGIMVCINIYATLNVYLLGAISGAFAVGLLTVGTRIIYFAQLLTRDLGMVLLPRMSVLHSSAQKGIQEELQQKSLQAIITYTMPLAFFLFFFSEPLVYLFAGAAYTNAIKVVQIVSLLPVITGISNIIGIQYLLPVQKERQLFTAVGLGALASIVLNLLLIPVWHHTGAAIALVLSEMIVTVSLLLLAPSFGLLLWKGLQNKHVLFLSFSIPLLFWALQAANLNNLQLLFSFLIIFVPAYLLTGMYGLKNEVIIESVNFLRNYLYSKNRKARA